ncbi:MAG: serine hydrolase [Isosphaeraceae bacterium]
MKRWLILATLAFPAPLGAMAQTPGALPRSAPEAQGISSADVLAFVDAADRQLDSMHGLVIVRHGKVIAEGWWAPYDASTPHPLYSLSKSFTSTAVGLAIAEGKLSLSDEILKFFADDAPAEPSANLKAMRVSDLLRMSTGHQAEPSLKMDATESWAKLFLAQPVPFKPGTHFQYNTPATYMLSAIVQKATGQTTLDYLRPRLFEPLGIEDPRWATSPQGVSLGGYGLTIKTEDIARFGQLYLNKGRWGGKQLIPESWVDAATALQTSNGSNPKSDWDQGYGYQFWRCRNGAYRGDGAFGQYCVVMPEQDTVVAINSSVRSMQEVLDLVWDRLLPALKSETLPPNESSATELRNRLGRLSIRPAEGSATSPMAAKVVGKTYSSPPNDRKLEAIRIENGGDGSTTIVARFDGGETRIPCGAGAWKKGRMAFGPGFPEQAAAASAAWTGEDTLTSRIVFSEPPLTLTLRIQFEGEEARLLTETNTSNGPASCSVGWQGCC